MDKATDTGVVCLKIALVTDLHFGARSDSLAFDNHFRKFYEEVFFPELDRQGI